MKHNEFTLLLLYLKLILMCSLISISGNNSPKGIRNLESSKDDKRTLQESDNYIIIQHGEEVKYDVDFLLENYRGFIKKIQNGDETIDDPSNSFTVEANTKLEVHFKEPLTTLDYFFNAYYDESGNFEKIISVDFSHFDSSSVTNMKYMFQACESLQSVDFSNFVSSSVTTLNNMFIECTSLQSVDFSNFDTSSITDMGYMFDDCTSLFIKFRYIKCNRYEWHV